MNMNTMLRAYSDVKTLSIALGITLTLGATLGYTLSPKPKQRALMCKLEIDQVNLFMNNFSKFLNNKKLRFSL